MNHDYESNLDSRLAAMLANPDSRDIPFLVACVLHWKEQADTLAAIAEINDWHEADY